MPVHTRRSWRRVHSHEDSGRSKRTKVVKDPRSPRTCSVSNGGSSSHSSGYQNRDADPLEQPMEPTSNPSGIEHQSDSESEIVWSRPMQEVVSQELLPSTSAQTRDSGVQTPANFQYSKTLPEDFKSSLECPVCSKISLPPIRQCRNGHVICSSCRLKIQSCPVCRDMDVDIRNLFAEKVITNLDLNIPCEYEPFGCRMEVQYKEKEGHESRCKYRPYNCPYIECNHKLAVDAIVEHVSTAHREECRKSKGPEIFASMILIGQYFGGDGAWSPRLITCFGRSFFDVALTRDRCLHHWVWLLGEENEAKEYLYEMTVFKGDTRYVYAGNVSSLRTSDEEIVSEGLCLTISDAIGRRLKDGDKIRYNLKLRKKREL